MAEHTTRQSDRNPAGSRLSGMLPGLQSSAAPPLGSSSNVRAFRFTLALMYVSIAGSIAYMNGLAACNTHLLFASNVELGAMLLALLGVEWYEQRRFAEGEGGMTAAILLGVRMLLFEGMRALDCTGKVFYLYPIIPYAAYFSFGANTSRLLSLFYVVLTLWRVSRADPLWYRDATATSNLLAFAFVMLLMPLIAHVIKRDEESRRRTEQLLSDLEASHVRLQTYAVQAADLAAAEERNRMARDIHDTLGHHLTAINIQLEKALVYRERDPGQAFQAIGEAKRAASEALQDVRRSVSALRNPDASFSLRDSLAHLVEGFAEGQLELDYLLEGSEEEYSTSALVALFRTAQEGLTNVQKHADAHHVTLHIALGELEAQLLLRDDGQGFDLGAADGQTGISDQTYGLRGIRERLAAVRGHLQLESRPQHGTELRVTIPRHMTLDT